METKAQSPVNNAMIYGLFTGIGMIVFMLILHLANLYLKPGINYLLYAVTIAGMYFGTVNYRNKFMDGYLTYGQSFLSNFLIGLFASILYIIFFYIYISFINPGMIDEMITMARQKLEESSANLTEDQMDTALSMQAKFMSPIMLTIFGFIGTVIGSVILALIISIFTRKNNPTIQTPIV